MKSPVFLNQNQKKFSVAWSHPNSQPIKARVLIALPWVDQSNWGIAMTEATTKNPSHSRHLLKFIRARQPVIPMTTIKLCAWTRASKPATAPAPSIRFAEGKRKKEKGKSEVF